MSPLPEEIAEEMGISEDKVREIIKIAQEPVSLETPIGEEEDSHLGDFIPDDDAPAPAEAAAFTLLQGAADERAGHPDPPGGNGAAAALRSGGRPRRARWRRWARNSSVTRERIRQIEAKALRKLRHPSRSQEAARIIWTDGTHRRAPLSGHAGCPAALAAGAALRGCAPTSAPTTGASARRRFCPERPERNRFWSPTSAPPALDKGAQAAFRCPGAGQTAPPSPSPTGLRALDALNVSRPKPCLSWAWAGRPSPGILHRRTCGRLRGASAGAGRADRPAPGAPHACAAGRLPHPSAR